MRCQMRKDCREPVTHIGNKGYIYCTLHAVERRRSGYERTRKMTNAERRIIENGGQLQAY